MVPAFILLIQLAAGDGFALGFDTAERCEAARRTHVERYARTHVVSASGCFPRALIEHDDLVALLTKFTTENPPKGTTFKQWVRGLSSAALAKAGA
jgi:hypothetical protein